MSKLDKLKKWAFENIDSLGEDVIRVVEQQAKLWSHKNEGNNNKIITEPVNKILKSLSLSDNSDSGAELIVAKSLMDHGIKFEQQHKVGSYKHSNGEVRYKYRLDFLIDGYLNVEIDGRAWHDKKKDHRRDEYLKKMGYVVVRFPATQVYYDMASIMDEIKKQLKI
jgi:very-short-patch-repair endonuclease